MSDKDIFAYTLYYSLLNRGIIKVNNFQIQFTHNIKDTYILAISMFNIY